MGVIFLFVDGVGMGDDVIHNPLRSDGWNSLQYMTGGQPFTRDARPVINNEHLFLAVDATLGVKGLPQSGTGQATLFSGQNGAKEIGKHFGPFPHSGIKHLLREQSLFSKAKAVGRSCCFINGYPYIYFEKAEEKNRWSCTTLMTKSVGVSLRTTEDVQDENAITAGINQKAWREYLSIDVPIIEPETAGMRLLNQSVKYDLTLHEYYMTDKAGHSQSMQKANNTIEIYDQFLSKLIDDRPSDTTIILSSDHGNIEDLSTKTHTRNRVPLFAIGPGATVFHESNSIMDVTPGILKILD